MTTDAATAGSERRRWTTAQKLKIVSESLAPPRERTRGGAPSWSQSKSDLPLAASSENRRSFESA